MSCEGCNDAVGADEIRYAPLLKSETGSNRPALNKPLRKSVNLTGEPGRGRPGFDVTDAAAARQFRKFAKTVMLDRNAGSPLWVQLKNQLETAIAKEILLPNTRLPSEQAMCEIFSLSRPVVRGALSALVSGGLVVKQPRKGNFVGVKRKEFDFMTSPLGVFDDLSSKGIKVSERTYEYALQPAEADEQVALNLPDGFDVIRFVRVYSADGVPITHSHISLPAHRLIGMEKFNMRNRSIYRTMRKNYGLSVARADRWISAGNADDVVAKRLRVEHGKALVYVRSIGYDHENIPLEFYRSYYNADVAPIHIATDP